MKFLSVIVSLIIISPSKGYVGPLQYKEVVSLLEHPPTVKELVYSGFGFWREKVYPIPFLRANETDSEGVLPIIWPDPMVYETPESQWGEFSEEAFLGSSTQDREKDKEDEAEVKK